MVVVPILFALLVAWLGWRLWRSYKRGGWPRR
jgi:hypothetical protein